MNTTETIVLGIILFLVMGVVAYIIETIIFRETGRIGRYEGLFEYFKKIDQKNGNITAAVWAGIWIALMVICGFLMYLMA